MTTTLDLSDLTDDGDLMELPDGRTLRLRVEVDMDYDPFVDMDYYGKIASLDRYGRQRPEGFTGNAEKLSIFNDVIWWEPPTGPDFGVKRSDPGFKEFRSLVQDLASFGGKVVTVEVLDGKDAYGRPIVVGVASLGGIDSLENGYLAEVVKELVDEALAENHLAKL